MAQAATKTIQTLAHEHVKPPLLCVVKQSVERRSAKREILVYNRAY